MEELKITYDRLQRSWFTYLNEYKPETEPGVYDNEFEDFIEQVIDMTKYMSFIEGVIKENNPKVSRKTYLIMAMRMEKTIQKMNKTTKLM
jgi:hypothetical protein